MESAPGTEEFQGATPEATEHVMGFDGSETMQSITSNLSSAMGMPPQRAWLVFIFLLGSTLYALYHVTRFLKNTPDTLQSYQAREDQERRRVLDKERIKARERQLQKLREEQKRAAAAREQKQREKLDQKLRRDELMLQGKSAKGTSDFSPLNTDNNAQSDYMITKRRATCNPRGGGGG